MEIINPKRTVEEIERILKDVLHRELTEIETELVHLSGELDHDRRSALLELLKELINRHKTI
jgi:hypothetical protein